MTLKISDDLLQSADVQCSNSLIATSSNVDRELPADNFLSAFECEVGTNYFFAETNDIHIVVDPLAGREDIVNQCGTDAGNFVRDDGRSDAAPADRHSAFNVTCRDSWRQLATGE